MGTLWEMTVHAVDRAQALSSMDRAFEEVARLERMMSRFLPDSQVSQLTRSAGHAPLTVECDLYDVLRLAQEVAERTGGAFDVTAEPLTRAWAEAAASGTMPDADRIMSALVLVGWDAIALDLHGPTARLGRPGMSLDLGAVGKGYAVDRAVECLQAEGYETGWVNAGGNLRMLGAWDQSIPVRDPRAPERMIARVAGFDGAISTSANYERGWRIGGRWYGHVLDPRTGHPARACMSATVLAPSAALADALSTACFVLGPEPGQAVCADWSGVDAFWCVESGDSMRIITTLGCRVEGGVIHVQERVNA